MTVPRFRNQTCESKQKCNVNIVKKPKVAGSASERIEKQKECAKRAESETNTCTTTSTTSS